MAKLGPVVKKGLVELDAHLLGFDFGKPLDSFIEACRHVVVLLEVPLVIRDVESDRPVP